ncbi:MAG: dihydrolipoyl dehydrogenase [Candidatus Aminicenantes bacterium]|nr:dihydrolipoyl dehydrogenase [Candidatus Aminicenantes bacterium]NIM78625.1 dihydrolipoyl dehydrogenase [Candidatus Aminicenantes bacterium]NIN17871.1 dihydrolipoyl dehydrogenase [Candidatus Aminicenantes bacterium]NIN41775.1 dihydrolipoyl dehydrogenase [Candidatus Aminicenantes bacterium]NIN84524.1 dihydrolipoyl dehydrogenase [Candidatus Aminicenantes bacterium]
MSYDIIFIGGGPAGYEGAIAAGKKGLKTAVVEMDKPGGTCLQRGCVPSKTLLHTVKFIKQIKAAAKAGVKIENYSVDLETIKKQKDRVVFKLTKGIETLFKQYHVEMINGKGKVTGKNKVKVVDKDGEKELESKHIVVSTGSVPAELPFLKIDGKYIIDSDKALELEDIPGKLLVIGAGAIGLEMAVVYNYLGSDVTVVEILDQVVPGNDAEVADILEKELKKQKIKVHIATTISNPLLNREENTIGFDFKKGEKEWQESFTRVLLSVGRRPFTEGVFADSLGIELDEKGFVKVNHNLQTKYPNIFACGDVIGQPLLAHKASHQAIAIVDFITEGKAIVHHPVPGAVYTFPELASIGLTEGQAREKGMRIKIGRFPYSAGSRSNAMDEKVGLVKVIADEANTLVGAHIVGYGADEMMPILNYAVTVKMKADDFKDMIFIHPTLSENIREAVGEISGFSIHI